MADFKPFAGVSQEESIQNMLYLLAAILDKLPRTDANDRLVINASEITPAATPVSGSLNAVTTINTLQGMGTQSAPTNAVPLHLANAGANYLYDRIIFS